MAAKIPYTCDWCGKIKMIPPSSANGTVFHACSNKCKYKLLSKTHKDWWKNLTPEQRNLIKIHMSENNHQQGEGLIEWHRALRPARVKKIIEIMSTPPIPVTPKERYAHRGRGHRNPRRDFVEELPRGTCTMIAAHHEMLKNDPERLSTEFMEKMCRVNCKCKRTKEEEQV